MWNRLEVNREKSFAALLHDGIAEEVTLDNVTFRVGNGSIYCSRDVERRAVPSEWSIPDIAEWMERVIEEVNE